MLKRLYLILTVFICIVFLFSACGSSSNSGAPANSVAANNPTPEKAASTAFKYYAMVDIGMTKDEVDQKTGLTAKQDTTDPVPQEGDTAYYYMDAGGEGIYVVFNKDLKLTSKTVQYTDPAIALVPYTSKPVTKDESDKITDGMSHADVVKLLGSEGAECSKTQSTVFGKTSIGTIYRWGNTDGSFIQVVFLADDTAHNAMYFDHG